MIVNDKLGCTYRWADYIHSMKHAYSTCGMRHCANEHNNEITAANAHDI
jgi:hypothetical protein